MKTERRSLRSRSAAVVAALLLGACGGGGSELLPPLPGIACSGAEQRLWLTDYFDEWYFWYRISPTPSPLPDRSVAELFQALLYKGGDSRFPADRWSRMERSADFDRFFTEGKTLGYGIFLAGLEVEGRPERPLRVRFVEARSDAADPAKDVRRGDEVVSANGRSAAQMIAANDFAVFTPGDEGQALDLVLRRDGVQRNVHLVARAYALTPLAHQAVVRTPRGRAVGYLMVKDMISQLEDPLALAVAELRSAGVQDLVIDLRYNGGGLVSVANKLASYVSASRAAGEPFVKLLFNDKRSRSNNDTFRFERPAAALDLPRVYVLTGPRTCSASELVINGLRPFAQVVTVGDTTCGKPVGFLPVSRCDTTFSVVNFESVNARDEGRYFDGLDASCEVSEDWSRSLGSGAEPLLAAALAHADNGRCPAAAGAAARDRRRALDAAGRRSAGEPPERQGMWVR